MEKLYVHEDIEHNKRAAAVVLPLVFDIFKPSSVADIGCGLATWASVCEDLGVKEVIGVDGDYVELERLKIDRSKFISHDLRMPLLLKKKYDMAVCLEVAEHIPEQYADTIVETLVNTSDLILFSSAIPMQNGQNHINEQLFEYWMDKFGQKEYIFYDVIRPVIWNNASVDWWYRQNIFIVARKGKLSLPKSAIYTAVHPESLRSNVEMAERYNRERSQLQQRYERGDVGMIKGLKIFLKALVRFKL
jgi:SAM-dependent methyltransferase